MYIISMYMWGCPYIERYCELQFKSQSFDSECVISVFRLYIVLCAYVYIFWWISNFTLRLYFFSLYFLFAGSNFQQKLEYKWLSFSGVISYNYRYILIWKLCASLPKWNGSSKWLNYNKKILNRFFMFAFYFAQ